MKNVGGTKPLISIVTPSLNQGKFIEQAITSIVGQDYSNTELIIIDGGSTDNTLDIIKKYSDKISYWISEPDNGPAEAINKGFRVAKGDILAWLNSDDMYLPCALSKAVDILGLSQEPRLVYGGCLHFQDGKKSSSGWLYDCGYPDEDAWGYIPPSFDREVLTYQDFIIQPATFWTRSLWKKTGELNESFSLTFDWEWFIRASQVCDFTNINQYLAIFRFHDNHISSNAGVDRSAQILKIVETYASREWAAAYSAVYRQLSRLVHMRKILHRLKMYNLRYLIHAGLYLNHGSRVDRALGNLYPKKEL